MWYLYTAVFLISIVSYNLVSKGCNKDLTAMKASQEEYLAEKKKIEEAKKLNNSTTYTLNS